MSWKVSVIQLFQTSQLLLQHEGKIVSTQKVHISPIEHPEESFS
jgi:hypothetical protein